MRKEDEGERRGRVRRKMRAMQAIDLFLIMTSHKYKLIGLKWVWLGNDKPCPTHTYVRMHRFIKQADRHYHTNVQRVSANKKTLIVPSYVFSLYIHKNNNYFVHINVFHTVNVYC